MISTTRVVGVGVIGTVVWGLLMSAGSCWGDKAADVPKDQLALTTQRLVIFKDGYGLVVKKGMATADNAGRVYTTDVPNGAVLGCFWAVAEDQKIVAMRAEWDQTTQQRSVEGVCKNVEELLRSNVGQNVSLELIDETEHPVSLTRAGRIVEMIESPAQPMALNAAGALAGEASPAIFTAYAHDDTVSYGSYSPEMLASSAGTLIRELTPSGGGWVRIEHDGLSDILPISRVKAVSGASLTSKITRRQELYTRSKRLSFDLGAAAATKPVTLHLFYFTPGLRWIPTYRLTGAFKDQADLALQGEILNDVGDVEHAAVDLVVGVGNFRFKDNPSPLTLEQVIRRTIAQADNNRYSGTVQMAQSQFSNVISNDRVSRGSGGAGEADMAMAPELAGAAEQDLFVYSSADFSLKKGGRATLPLWQQTTALRHVYTYDIRARRNVRGGYADEAVADSRSPLRLQTNQVWHQLELTNAGKVPWTTGAALMMRDALPLGQELLTYTPASAKALLPVTLAVDLHGSFEEQETARQPKALRIEDVQFTQITKRGTVTLSSFRPDKSEMRITLSTGGKVIARSDNGLVKINDMRFADWEDNAPTSYNNHSDVVWEVSVDPGQTKTLTYDVQFYVRDMVSAR